MKNILIVTIFVSCWLLLESQTIIPFGNVSGTWNISGSPYLVEGDITLQDGQTLVIEPGCVIEFQGFYRFTVGGKLMSVGTVQDSIVFTVSDTTGFHSNSHIGWRGIECHPAFGINDSMIIKYSVLEFGKNYSGGVIHSVSKPFLISNSLIRYNYATSDGGGLYLTRANVDPVPEISNCIIEYNIASSEGGGIRSYNNIIIQNNIIRNNYASKGGGLYISKYTNNPNNCCGNLIYANEAQEVGGGILIKSTNLVNCTILNNVALSGAGIYCFGTSNSYIKNCIVYGNMSSLNESQIHLNAYWESWFDPQLGVTVWDFYPANLDMFYTDIENGYEGIFLNYEGSTTQHPITYDFLYENNIDSNPLFIDPENCNFRLYDNSPCVNTGSPDTTGLNLPEYDIDGNQRIYGGRIDIGAYENQNVVYANENLIPIYTKLYQNYPNPFNPSTTIEFSIHNNSLIDISVFNIKGQRIKTLANHEYTKGTHSIIWNGDNELGKQVSSGIFYYKLKVNGKTEVVKKCLLLK